jgi:hypothetical protein
VGEVHAITRKGIEIDFSECLYPHLSGGLYEVEYDGEKKLIRWFQLEYLKSLHDSELLYHNLEKDIGVDDDNFLYPIDITEKTSKGFGYIINNVPASYVSFRSIVEGTEHFSGWQAILNAALGITETFIALKRKNRCFGNFTEDDILVNKNTGAVRFVNAEQIKQGSSWHGGTISCLMLPGCFTGDKKPGKASDAYLLAVLLFELLCQNHPLEGHAAAACPVLNDDYKQLIYGKNPCFIYDEEDTSNRPVRGIHVNVLILWNRYPLFIKEAFQTAFSKKVMQGEEKYIPAERWFHLIVLMRSNLITCPYCGREMLRISDDQRCSNARCRQKAEPIRYYYRTETGSYPMIPGGHLYQCQIDNQWDYKTPIGVWNRQKVNSSVYLLQNVTDEDWKIKTLDSDEHVLNPQDACMVEDQMKILIAGHPLVVETVMDNG